MCRAILAGGRRCPCSYAPARSAADRARYAARKAAVATAPPPAPGAAFIRQDVINVEDLRALAADTAELFSGRPPETDEIRDLHREIAEARARNEPTDDLQARLDDALERRNAFFQRAEDAETQLRRLGEQVAGRAEEIAGITAGEVKDRFDARLEAAVQRVKDLEEQSAAKQAELRVNELHADYRAAHKAFVEADPNNREAEATARREAEDTYNAAADQFRAFKEEIGVYEAASIGSQVTQGLDPDTREDLTRLAKGYQTALAEVRGELGGQISWHKLSSKPARVLFDAATQVYPTQWVEASNRRNSPVAKATAARAHYADGKIQTTRKRERLVLFCRISEEEFQKHQADTSLYGLSAGYERATPEERKQAGCDFKRMSYEVYSPWSHRSRNGKPTGPGWQQVSYTDADGAAQTTWRRPRTRMVVVEAERISELTVSGGINPVGQPGYATAVHEMAHRMEASVPMIGQMESRFLERRTTGADGEREPLKTLYAGTRERARPDDFIHPYMGKEYDGVTHFEVMSTGSESLFAGQFGGLVGAKKGHKADLDHRAFVLGVLASARP